MADQRIFSRQSSDLRLGDSLLGLPCLKRRRAEIKADSREDVMKMMKCPLCGMEVPELMYALHEATDQLIINRMQNSFPGWQTEDGVCEPCLERFRKLEAGGHR